MLSFNTVQEIVRIAEIQEAFRSAGYQWIEHIFNDGHYVGECSIKFTRSKEPNYFTDYPVGDFGWGRYTRIAAWSMAYEWLFKRLTGAEEHREPQPFPRPE